MGDAKGGKEGKATQSDLTIANDKGRKGFRPNLGNTNITMITTLDDPMLFSVPFDRKVPLWRFSPTAE